MTSWHRNAFHIIEWSAGHRWFAKKGQECRAALMLSVLSAPTNYWTHSPDAGDLKCHDAPATVAIRIQHISPLALHFPHLYADIKNIEIVLTSVWMDYWNYYCSVYYGLLKYYVNIYIYINPNTMQLILWRYSFVCTRACKKACSKYRFSCRYPYIVRAFTHLSKWAKYVSRQQTP